MGERLPLLEVEVRELREEIAQRHHENERRFDRIEQAAATMNGEVKVIIALLVANGALNLAGLFSH